MLNGGNQMVIDKTPPTDRNGKVDTLVYDLTVNVAAATFRVQHLLRPETKKAASKQLKDALSLLSEELRRQSAGGAPLP